MNKRKVKALLPILAAYAAGKTIQYRISENEDWTDCAPTFFYAETGCYRIKPKSKSKPRRKPEPVWRPYNSTEAFAKLSHTYIRHKVTGQIIFAAGFYDNGVILDDCNYSHKTVLDEWETLDGATLGIRLDRVE